MVVPSYLSFPIVERVEQEPLVVRRVNCKGEPGMPSEAVRRSSLVEREGAVGPRTEPIVPPEVWADLSGLELYKKEPKAKIRSNGAEVVVPYRWPADRRKNESQEEYESRLAEYELEVFLNPQGPMTSMGLEEARAKPVLRKEDMESGEPTPRAQRFHSPHPGPPVRRVVETGTRPKEPQRNSRKGENCKENKLWIPRKSGIIFGGLKEIPTSDILDPPPFCCFNCWERGHRVVDCPHLIRHQFFRNCGRRETTVKNCPRCAEAYCRFAGCPGRYDEVVEISETKFETNEIAEVITRSIKEGPSEEEESHLSEKSPNRLVNDYGNRRKLVPPVDPLAVMKVCQAAS
ncbi:uncharacterized protein LOC122507548 [Leptopilina heterotoma]|uniref:uncharacterized protein LOC122507548 n=1 Tax=Leptopilina heterotoma TaxID=63436 RepID=UPI001CA83210|nr:uncharacterized protein LOC122507548 [Leptopilina heterotoma]